MKALRGELRQFNGGVYLGAQSPGSRLARAERLAARLTPLDDALSNTITGILNNPPHRHLALQTLLLDLRGYLHFTVTGDSRELSGMSGIKYMDEIVVLFATIKVLN